jgi:DHA1 family bicyclomycin/chloramphenicol resistance-like MFS transporter
MTSFLGGIEVILDDVFDKGVLFPYLFAVVALGLGTSNFLSGTFVARLGLRGLLRRVASYLVVVSGVLATVAIVTDGHPPLWVFVGLLVLMLPASSMLVPNCNSAAMVPLAHVAGMAAAVLGALSSGLGAVIGGIVSDAFDGSVRPFCLSAFACSLIATTAIVRATRGTREVGPQI